MQLSRMPKQPYNNIPNNQPLMTIEQASTTLVCATLMYTFSKMHYVEDKDETKKYLVTMTASTSMKYHTC